MTTQTRPNPNINPASLSKSYDDPQESWKRLVIAGWGRNNTGTDWSPAENFLAFGLGFDILLSNEFTRGGGNVGSDEVFFRVFDSNDLLKEWIPLNELTEEIYPSESAIPLRLIQNAENNRELLDDLQEFHFIEQMNLACEHIQESLSNGVAGHNIVNKPGVTEGLQDHMEEVMASYTDGNSSTSLSSFGN